MFSRLSNDRLRYLIAGMPRWRSIQSNINLDEQMKKLNDQKQYEKCLDLFDKYQQINKNKPFSSLSVTQALKACTRTDDFQRGLTIASILPSRLKNDPTIITSFIHFYMQCGHVKQAEELFDKSNEKTLFMYGALMKGYIKTNEENRAIDLFGQIKNPDAVIFILLLNACARLQTKEASNIILKISQEIPKRYLYHKNLLSSLLDALMKCGHIADASKLFEQSPEKTLEMYGAMMKGYIQNNQANLARDLFHHVKNPDDILIVLLLNACAQMGTEESLEIMKKYSKEIEKRSQSNSYVATSFIDALMKCGCIDDAQKLFHSSKKKVLPMYGAMLKGFIINDEPHKAIDLFYQMKNEKISINEIIAVLGINAAAQIGDMSIGQSIVEQIPKNFLSSHYVQNTLIDMWGKVGCVDQAKNLFEKICQPDDIGYSAMINTYGLSGMATQAIDLFHRIPSKYLKESTYVCVLNACSHAGLVNEARLIFNNIPRKTERIFCTMIDCLSRASFFEEAQQIIDQYESNHTPAWTMYMSLLSGARNAKNKQLSEETFDRMKKYFPELSNELTSGAILLANVYASSGHVDKASDIRIQLHKTGVKKKMGFSWTVVDGEIHQFKANDQTHRQSSEIHIQAQKLSEKILKHGHEYDSSWITRPLNPDETVKSVLSGHSERLAISFNFLRNPNASRIQITNNLRICGDCHRAIKLIAAIYQCEIIVRDTNRIHHVHKNGQCSCNDYY